MSEESALELQSRLKRIFFGRIPPFYWLLIEQEIQQEEPDSFMERQGVSTLHDLNYVTYSHDTFQELSPKMREYIAHIDDKGKEKEKAELLEANRLFLTTIYLEACQDVELSIEKKYELTCSFKTYLYTLSMIMGCECMSNQKQFQLLLENNETLYRQLVQEEGDSKESEQNTLLSSDKKTINTIWRNGAENLHKASQMLYDLGYTDTAEAFEQIFIIEQNYKCNWLKRKTSLLYLFGILTSNEDKVPDFVLVFICDKITFKGQPITRHSLKTQLSKISNVFSCHQRNLTEQYSEIFHIIDKIRQ